MDFKYFSKKFNNFLNILCIHEDFEASQYVGDDLHQGVRAPKMRTCPQMRKTEQKQHQVNIVYEHIRNKALAMVWAPN